MTISRSKPLRNKRHRQFVNQLPCAVCHAEPSECAHVRIGFLALGMKPGDNLTVPLCAGCHRTGPKAQHSMNESAFWAMHRIDPVTLALHLWNVSGNYEVARRFVLLAKEKAPYNGPR